MEHTKIQWHPGFVAAMNLEFSDNRDDLIFEPEYNLNTKPLEIDLLVIKKQTDVSLSNEIGSFFRGHNIMEYKSPDDHLDIDVFYKSMAYAALYKSYGRTLDEIKADDLTVTLIREAKPEGLFRYLKERRAQISNPYKGIYYISGKILFPTQIVVTGELNRTEHIWLGSLSARLQKQDMKDLFDKIHQLETGFDRQLADSVLEVSVGANRKVLESWKGDDTMCQALMEIMEPEIRLRENEFKKACLQEGIQEGLQKGIQEGLQKGIREGLQKGIQGSVDMLRRFGHPDDEIKTTLMNEYSLTSEEAEKYFQ